MLRQMHIASARQDALHLPEEEARWAQPPVPAPHIDPPAYAPLDLEYKQTRALLLHAYERACTKHFQANCTRGKWILAN